MPRLPDFGSVTPARGGGRVVPVQADQTGVGLQQMGETLYRVNAERQERDARTSYSKARAQFAIEQTKMLSELQRDTDYRSFETKYEGMRRRISELGSGVTDPAYRAQFEQDAELDYTQGMARVQGLAWDREVDHENAALDKDLTVLHEAFLTEKDSAARARHLENARTRILAAQENGYLDETRAQEKSQRFATDVSTSFIEMQDPATQLKMLRDAEPEYGQRADGSRKALGFLGPLPVKGGGDATEYSIADSEQIKNPDGSYRDYPTLVPTLTEAERKQMVEDIIPNKKPIPPEIARKAEEHALKRIEEGKSPFASNAESPAGGIAKYIPADTRARMAEHARNKLETERNKYLANALVTTAADVVKLPTDPDAPIDRNAAYAQAKKQVGGLEPEQDLRLRSYIEQTAANLEQDRRLAQQTTKSNLMDEIELNGGDFPKLLASRAAEVDSLPREQRVGLERYAVDVATGAYRPTNGPLFMQLADDPALLRQTNLGAIRDQFNPAEYNTLVKAQQDMEKDASAEQNVRATTSVVNSMLPKGISDENKASFYTSLQMAVDAERAGTGKEKVSQARVKELAAELLTPMIEQDSFLWFDRSRELYRIEIPPDVRANIEAGLQAEGMPVNEFTVRNAYKVAQDKEREAQ